MKIVISMQKEYYEAIKQVPDRLCDAEMLIVKNGTPLDSISTISVGVDGKAVQIYPNNEVLDKIKDEIKDRLYVNSPIFRELIDYRNGKITTDDIIEKFNRVTRQEVLQIIGKYKAESEE